MLANEPEDGTRLHVAVVGVGRGGQGWGGRGHIPALRLTPGIQLSAVCTDHETTARAAAQHFGVDRYFSSVDELAAADDIDLVTVATRARFHHQIVRPLLRAGKMVYCEWPLGIHAAEAAEITSEAQTLGVLTGVGTQGRHSPTAQRVRQLLAAGDIGRPLFFHATEFVPRPALRADQWWVHTRSDDAAVLGVLTAHLTDLIQYLLGPIRAVSGHALTVLPEDVYADTGEAFRWSASDTVGYQARLESDVIGSVQLTGVVAADDGFRLDIVGESGQLRLTSPWYSGFGPTSVLRMGRGQAVFEPVETGASWNSASPADLGPMTVSRAFGDFRRAWLDGEPFGPSFADATQLHRVLDSVQRSWVEERWIQVDGSA